MLQLFRSCKYLTTAFGGRAELGPSSLSAAHVTESSPMLNSLWSFCFEFSGPSENERHQELQPPRPWTALGPIIRRVSSSFFNAARCLQIFPTNSSFCSSLGFCPWQTEELYLRPQSSTFYNIISPEDSSSLFKQEFLSEVDNIHILHPSPQASNSTNRRAIGQGIPYYPHGNSPSSVYGTCRRLLWTDWLTFNFLKIHVLQCTFSLVGSPSLCKYQFLSEMSH